MTVLRIALRSLSPEEVEENCPDIECGDGPDIRDEVQLYMLGDSTSCNELLPLDWQSRSSGGVLFASGQPPGPTAWFQTIAGNLPASVHFFGRRKQAYVDFVNFFVLYAFPLGLKCLRFSAYAMTPVFVAAATAAGTAKVIISLSVMATCAVTSILVNFVAAFGSSLIGTSMFASILARMVPLMVIPRVYNSTWVHSPVVLACTCGLSVGYESPLAFAAAITIALLGILKAGVRVLVGDVFHDRVGLVLSAKAFLVADRMARPVSIIAMYMFFFRRWPAALARKFLLVR